MEKGSEEMRLAVTLTSLALLSLTPFAAAAQEPGQQPLRRVTLAEAVDVALRNNPALQQSASDMQVARANRTVSYGNFLPNISLGSGYTNSSSARLDATGQAIVQTSYTAQLIASINLFEGLRRFSELDRTKHEVAAEQASYRQSRFETTLFVKTAYYNSVASRELVRVQEERVTRQEDQLDFVRQRVSLGRATRSDLLRSQVDLNDAKLGLLNARNAARTSTFGLAETMGIDERVEPVAEATLEIEPLPFQRQELERIALASGPSVVSAREGTAAAKAGVASARSAYLPTFSFTGSWDWADTEFPPSNRSWSVRIVGNYPLFNGFQRESSVSRARAQADARAASERAAELAIRADVDAAYSQIETAQAGVRLAEQNVDLTREDLRVSQQRYRLGVATILDLQSAQIALNQAEVDLIVRRFDYQIGLARLEALLGQSLRD